MYAKIKRTHPRETSWLVSFERMPHIFRRWPAGLYRLEIRGFGVGLTLSFGSDGYVQIVSDRGAW
jgi:hypothetical protein